MMVDLQQPVLKKPLLWHYLEQSLPDEPSMLDCCFPTPRHTVDPNPSFMIYQGMNALPTIC